MKSLIVMMSLFVAGSQALAGTPIELKNLLPVGKDELTLKGTTPDKKDCAVELFSARDQFSASLIVYYAYAKVDSFRSGKFQLGRDGTELSDERELASTMNFETITRRPDPDRDVRTTFKIYKENQKLKAVQLVVEDQTFLGFSTRTKESCFLK